MDEEINKNIMDSIYELDEAIEEAMIREEELEDKGVRDEEYPLPQIIQDWVNVGSEYSKYNEFPLTMCYFNILGQIVKDFIQIPLGANRLDTRLHFIWLQTARTGKSALWKLMNYSLQGTYKNINALILNEDDEEIKSKLSNFDIFDISVYTSAALIGTFVENDSFEHIQNDNFECSTFTEGITECDCESDENPRKTFIPGALHGSGIAHWDEFESSGIFKMKKHNEDMLLTFQTFMNDIDVRSDGHVMTKHLAGCSQTGRCDCQRSLYATSYVPDNLAEVIRNSGVLQRAFVHVREVPNHIRSKMHESVVANIGQEVDDELPVQKFIKHFTDIHQRVLKKWKDVECHPTKIIKIPKEVNDVINQYKIKMENYIETCRPELQTAVQSFSINLILYQVKISMFIALAEGRFNITANDVHCAGRLVEKAYMSLVGWLEQGIRVQRQTLSDKVGINTFKQSYFDSKKDENGYTLKKEFLAKSAAALEKSPKQTYRNYNQIKDKFEETKIGRSVYIKYIGD